MNAVLDIVKRYLFEILCGAAAALGIALSLWGMGGMADITTEMQKAKAIKDQLHTLSIKSNPTNMKAVAQAQERIDKIHATYAEVLDFVRQRNQFEPLLPDVFPETTKAKARTDFQKAYRDEVGGWLKILKAGDVPTEDAIAQERDRMEAELSALQMGGGAVIPPKDPSGEGEAPPVALENNPRVRAAIRNAKEIYCYAKPDVFNVSTISNRSGGPMYKEEPASMEDLWRAQLEVWVQRSVIDAIRASNDAAAERIRLRETDNHPWVGNLPIKELVSLQTTTYYVMEGSTATGRSTGTSDRAYPPGDAASVFTGNKSNPLFETMQFTVQLVVDARDIPRVIADLCSRNFHTPLRVSYEAVPPNVAMEGKIYGEEPTVRLVVDFETAFFSELYLPLIPDKILKELGKERPKVETADGK